MKNLQKDLKHLKKNMLIKCKTKSGESIQVYDLDYLHDLDLKDFGLTDIEEINELDENLPVYPLNDIILSQLTKKSTDSQKLENLGLYVVGQLQAEHAEVDLKRSKLSYSQRELVNKRFNEIKQVLQDPKNGKAPEKQDDGEFVKSE